MQAATVLLSALVLALATCTVHAADPQYRTYNGGTVIVDPDTNRATITRGGVTTPLWDGTHRMQDGSTLIINRGIAVPDQRVLESRHPPPPAAEEWVGAPIAGYSPCEQLVRRVCGRENQCGNTEGCNLARQLHNMEDTERNESGYRYRMTYTSGQCKQVESDNEVFPPCPGEAAEKAAGPAN